MIGIIILLGIFFIFIIISVVGSMRETRKLEEKILGRPRTKGKSFINEYLEMMTDISPTCESIEEEEEKRRKRREHQRMEKRVHELMVKVHELNQEYEGRYNRFDILDLE